MTHKPLLSFWMTEWAVRRWGIANKHEDSP